MLFSIPVSHVTWTSLVAQLVVNPPAKWETWVQSLAWEVPLEKEMATHSSILAWRILYSPWGHKELDMTEQSSFSSHYIQSSHIKYLRLIFETLTVLRRMG